VGNTLKYEVFDFKSKNVCRGLVHWTQCTQPFQPQGIGSFGFPSALKVKALNAFIMSWKLWPTGEEVTFQ